MKIIQLYVGALLSGSNESKQYNGELVYSSIITEDTGRIRFEVSIREPLIDRPVDKKIKTLVLNPFSGMPYVAHFDATCFSFKEAYAEKIRAALCRRQPAIRDFFDIYYAVSQNLIDLDNTEFIDAILQKIHYQSNDPVLLNKEKYIDLKSQIETELFPTLRQSDYNHFDLEFTFNCLRRLAEIYITTAIL